jgi:Matrixin
VASNGDIRASFGGSELNPKFGMPGGVQASAPYPERGRLRFDNAEIWTSQSLTTAALHELGHALGLSHSNKPTSLMNPFNLGAQTIDAESRDALRNLYGWRPQIALVDRATSDRPAMAVSTRLSFTVAVTNLHMVWKGSLTDPRIYESRLENNAWTPQTPIAGAVSSHSPAITSFQLHDGTPSTALIMAFKGPGDPAISDQGLY